jgi:hypothetical protein
MNYARRPFAVAPKSCAADLSAAVVEEVTNGKRRRRTGSRIAGAIALLVAAPAHAELIYGITNLNAFPQLLVRFDSASPANVTTIGPLSGAAAGSAILAIDFSPATGQLFAGAGAGNAGQTYNIDLNTGALTPVGDPFVVSDYGFPSFDFNPVSDEVRVITTDAAITNTRFSPVTGGLIATDVNVAFAAGDPNAGSNPPNVIGVAHSNNFAGATASTVYAYDVDTDVLATVGGIGGAPSPNGGQMFTVGGSGYVANSVDLGFDISGVTGVAYVTGSFDGLPGQNFFTMNLDTGQMTHRGALGGDGVALLDIAVAVPEPSAGCFLTVASVATLRRRRR